MNLCYIFLFHEELKEVRGVDPENKRHTRIFTLNSCCKKCVMKPIS